MGLETGTFISDLVVTNPPSGDPIAQGDDHIRLLKTTLKNTFPTASKAVYSPTSRTLTAGTTAATVADQNCLFLLNTTAGQVDLFMPTLSAGDAGWSCSVVKISGNTTSAFIRPPSGTIVSGDVSVAYARRCIPWQPRRVWWTGGNWVVERVPSVPVGTVLEYQGGSLPAGYEWPNGQTLSPTNYPEYATVRGGGLTQDRRGRYGAMADQGAGRIGGGFAGGINTGAYDGVGGEYIHQLTTAELASHQHSASIYDAGHAHTASTTANTVVGGFGLQPGSGATIGSATVTVDGAGTGIRVWDGVTMDVTYFQGGSGYHNNLPPTLVTHFILVVE